MSGQLTLIDAPPAAATAAAAPRSSTVRPAGGAEQSRPLPRGPRQSAPASPRAHQTDWSAYLSDLITLTKPRIVVMILVTTAVAAAVAAGTALEAAVLLHTLLGTGLVAAGAGAINQLLERERDLQMPRTATRPLPAGRVAPAVACAYSLALLVFGTGHLAYHVGLVPAAFAAVTWLIYAIIYTPLKTRTSFNTTVGAVAGALPIFVGYTAAGGSLAEINGWLLFGVLVFWQYPHFMAIAWLYRRQYGDAGFKMTPVVEPTGRSAGLQSVVGGFLLAACGAAIVIQQPLGVWLALAVVAVSGGLITAAVRFNRDPEDRAARSMLRHSLLQLPAVMLIILLSAFL